MTNLGGVHHLRVGAARARRGSSPRRRRAARPRALPPARQSTPPRMALGCFRLRPTDSSGLPRRSGRRDHRSASRPPPTKTTPRAACPRPPSTGRRLRKLRLAPRPLRHRRRARDATSRDPISSARRHCARRGASRRRSQWRRRRRPPLARPCVYPARSGATQRVCGAAQPAARGRAANGGAGCRRSRGEARWRRRR